MKKSIVDSLSFALFKKFLPFAFLMVTLAIVVPLFLLWEEYKIEALRSLACLAFLIGLCATVFTSREILIRMEEDSAVLFSDALAHTLYRYLTYLCFVPLIGPAIQRFVERRRAKNPFTSDEE